MCQKSKGVLLAVCPHVARVSRGQLLFQVLYAPGATSEQRAGYAATANWHDAAEISPGSDLAGKGGLTLTSGDGKHLSRAQFQCMDLWLRTGILLFFSRLAEYIGLWMKA